MRLIVDLFYILIWVLVKTGDSVLFVFSLLLFSPKRLFLLTPTKKRKRLKKQKTLFKAARPKKPFFTPLFKKLASKGINTVTLTSKAVVSAGKTSGKIFQSTVKHLVTILVSGIKKVTRVLLLPFVLLLKVKELFKRGVSKKKHKKVGRPSKKVASRPTAWYGVKLFVWGIAFSSVFVFLPLLSLIFLSDLPNPSSISTNYISKSTKILDRNGTLLYEVFANQNRTIVKLDQIPKNLKNATIAIEDRDFYTHPGFDIKGIARALYSNSQNNDLQGGSTITQQLVKSALLTPEPSITRKVKEIILAFWAERIYSKDKILALYFNYIPYGGTAWGVSAASDVYFGKKIEQLDLAESAFLAGLPRAPSVYSPYAGTGNLWKKRQKQVLDAMVLSKYITKKEASNAYKKELVFAGPNIPIKAPHFVMYVKEQLVKQYGLSEVERGGLVVKTTLDSKLQETVQDIVTTEVENDAYLQITNGASVVINPKNGDILAMVGSKNYFDLQNDGNVNLVTSLRQPGSTIKIVTYSLALSSGYTQATLVDDSPFSISPQGGETYTPVNYDGKFRGRIPLRLAFANSLNIPAVRVAQKLGVENIVEQGKKLGITTWEDADNYGLSITLGGAETTMLDLTTVYSTIANSGKRVLPSPILSIKDAMGETIYEKVPTEEQVIDPGVAFIISDILSDNRARSMEFGSNSPLHVPNHRVSVKTGTTDNKRDNWTVGYTPNYVVATWVGNNDNSPMSQQLASGITGAAPMWNKIITKLLENTQDEPLVIPASVVKKGCSGGDLYFLRGTEGTSCGYRGPESPTPFRTAFAQ